MTVSLVKNSAPSYVTLVKRSDRVRVWRRVFLTDSTGMMIDRWDNLGVFTWQDHLEALKDFRALDLEYGCIAVYTSIPIID